LARLYRFPVPLKEGIVLRRPNRFVMYVRTDSGTIRAHCPTTGRLGDARIENIPCLYQPANRDGRKTKATVQAISFDSPTKKRKSWIGINQVEANRYVEFFLKTGQLEKMASGPIQREVKLGKSRIDFRIGNAYLEVKTPLILLPNSSVETVRRARFDSYDRLIRHMGELSRALRSGSRAVIALCFLYNAKRFIPPPRTKYNARILKAAREVSRAGVERWQINLGIGKTGVRILRYFRNDTDTD
jgi:sugar fermentation stimulation protein A